MSAARRTPSRIGIHHVLLNDHAKLRRPRTHPRRLAAGRAAARHRGAEPARPTRAAEDDRAFVAAWSLTSASSVPSQSSISFARPCPDCRPLIAESNSPAEQLGSTAKNPQTAGRFSLTQGASIDTIPLMSNRTIFSCEAPMLRLQNVNSHSEHDLFIRLFLTGGGGW